MSIAEARLIQLAHVIRSKNASIYHVTLDIIFDDPETYESVRDSGAVTRETIANLYGIELNQVEGVVAFDPGLALKINLRRGPAGGGPGETDVFGSQFSDPLYDLKVRLHEPEPNER
jgi:hypothetical protein